MTNWMARILNWEASRAKYKAHEIVERLQLRKGDTVADIGSGGGFFTCLFSEMVGESGAVCAVDISRKNLDFIQAQAAKKGLRNIKTVLVEENRPDLPEGGIDKVFARNVFHHIEDPGSYFSVIRRSMKPDGKVVIIDYGEKAGGIFAGVFGRHTPEEKIVDIMAEAGFKLSERSDFLPGQSFLVFELSK